MQLTLCPSDLCGFLHYFVFKYYRFPIYDETLIFLMRITSSSETASLK
jgi:hypothetical protein